ncbi:NAD(P)-binding protein [Backusella circina FSU 941]|nr:NAD(P)-binding protein [Backusella circina FSU 941]
MSIPTEQTVFRITGFSGQDDIKSFKEPVTVNLEKDEVLVKIKAVSLNYRDLVISNNTFIAPTKKNVVPGSDASGEIVKVGSDVKHLEVGDRVITNFDAETFYGPIKAQETSFGLIEEGVLAQYRVFSKYSINKIPKDSHLTDEEASVLVCTGVTAWNALYGSSESFVAGQTVLILGTGGLSVTALVLAKAAGAVTIITSSSDEKLKYVKEKYGADHTINYSTNPDWDQEVLKLTNGEGVDLVVENGGNGTVAKSIASTKFGGQVALIGFVTQPKEMPDMLTALISKTVTARGIFVGSKQLAEGLIKFVHAKKLRMPVEKVFGFNEEEVHAAYVDIKNTSHVGKIVIKVD